MEITTQQKYVTLAFVYGDNRQFIDLLDPNMFWDYAVLIWIIKENQTRDDIWKKWLEEWVMWEMIECDTDVAMYYRINAWQELMRLWEMFITYKYKTGKKKLDRETAKRINELFETLKKRLDVQSESNVLDEAKQYISMAKEKNWVKTGIECLDNRIWWLRSGTITRLSGYSNVGKSRFMYRVVANVLKQGKSVHVFSLEVPKGMVIINLVGAYYNVSTSAIENWNHDDKLEEFYTRFKDTCCIEDDKMSLEQIESSITFNNKDVIFIDYVQNIRAAWKEEYERMTKIAQELQKMAITTKKPFFDLSQVSNEGTRYKVGDMIPSKGSGAFVHACEIGLVLYKHDDPKKLCLAVAKNKFWLKDIELVLDVDMASCGFKLSAVGF